nr:autotransporter outer membrane beta-barrel domain-containing protein [uncultured Pseudomonas sp.]
MNKQSFCHPYSRTLAAAVVLFSMSPNVHAGVLIPDLELTIGPDAPVETWVLNSGSILNTLPGTNTLNITSFDGGTLNMQGSTVTGGAIEGINLLGSTATLVDTTVTSTGGFGLQINRNAMVSAASSASVTGGSISGVGAGIIATFESSVELNGVTVNGAAGLLEPLIDGGGILLTGGNASVLAGSTVTGSNHGVIMTHDSIGGVDEGNNTLVIDASTVTGTASSAIFLNSLDAGTPVNATIAIVNGAQLNGGNGLALEVGADSTALVTVDGSRLNGGILVQDGSNASVALNNNSSVSGNVTNVADFSLDNGSSLTGNLTRTNTLAVSNNSSVSGNVTEVDSFSVSANSQVSGAVSDVGNLNVSAGSSVSGSVNNVQSFNLSGNSLASADVSDVGSFDVSAGSSVSGSVNNVQSFNLTRNSSATADVSNVESFTVSDNSSVTGNLNNVTNLSLNNSTWTTNDGQGVTNLAMNAGTVKLGAGEGTFETLNVSTLSGSGRFIMDTDLATHQSDLVNVSGQAAGDYDLQIKNTGVDPVKGEDEQRVVHTGAGSTAQFSVVGGQVDFGTFAYELEQRDSEWYLVQKFDDDGDPEVTPGTRSVIGLFSAAPTVWYGELSSLRSRMGELRYGEAQGGAWTRAYGNKYNMSAAGGTAYQQNQHGVSFGADAPLPVADGQWLVGVLAGYSRSDLDIAAGTSGHVDSYYLGAYTTWLSDSGYYVDAVVKANRFKNTSDVRMSDGEKSEGDYNTSGIGASVEAGKHIKLQDDWFVEPFAQVSTLWVKGEDYSLDNGMDASSNKADSFLGKLGTTVGRNFPLDKGGYVQPYVKVAVAHEFAKSNRVKVNDNTFSNDLSGSRGELGAGIAAQLTDVLQLHADVDYSNGQNIEQPWGVNVGLRYSW